MSNTSTQAHAVRRPLISPQWCAVTTLAGEPEWLTDARRAISRLTDLQVGWDGGTSPPIQRPAIESAWLITDILARYDELSSPHVGPTVGGGLGIEWHNGSRELDFEFLPDGTVLYLKTEAVPGSQPVLADGEITPDQNREVRSLAVWLMTGV